MKYFEYLNVSFLITIKTYKFQINHSNFVNFGLKLIVVLF